MAFRPRSRNGAARYCLGMTVTFFEKNSHNVRTLIRIAVDADSRSDLIGNPPQVGLSGISYMPREAHR
jgi:hypothetical protein